MTRKTYPDAALLSKVERRLLVRAVFSFIEAVVFMLKDMALASCKPDSLSPGEIALANEDQYELDDSGEVMTRPAQLKFLSNFRFAFRIADKAGKLEYKLDVASADWLALRNALKVRDRLTHPKGLHSVVVTDDEVRDAMRAFAWVAKELMRVCARTLMSPSARGRVATVSKSAALSASP
jgi:hypothetical protein